MKSLNDWARDVYDLAKSKGWHTNDAKTNLNEMLPKYLMNLHAEISEMWEAWRKGNINAPCDKSSVMRAIGEKELTCFEEELADVIIRALDAAHAFGIDIEAAIESKHAYNATRTHRHGGKLA